MPQRKHPYSLDEMAARYRALLDAAVDAIVFIDERGVIETFSPAAERIFGYRAEEVLGEKVQILMPSPYREEHDGYLDRYLETGERRIIGIGREVVGKRKDGSEFPIDLAVGEIRLGSRRLFVGTIRDITERKGTEEQLRQSQKMEALGLLAGGVAHDFNTLLGSVSGYAERLVERLQDAGLRHAAEQIRQSAERGAALTRQLLAFSHVRASEPEVVDLNSHLPSVRDMLGRLIGERVHLELDLCSRPVAVHADPRLLEQVVMNLVVNAVDAVAGAGTIRVGTSIRDVEHGEAGDGDGVAAGRYAVLEVADDGCGMTEEVRRRIFDPFFTTKAPGKGTGLGLSTVYGLVHQFGGNVRVESRPDEGSTFTVVLPLVDARPAARRAAPPPRNELMGSETVLLVEDDDTFRQLVAEMLSDHGYTVLAAPDAGAGLARIERHDGPLELVLSDVGLPGMRVTEMIERLKRQKPDVRVLLMSGYSPEDVADEVQEAGLPLIQKPFTTRALLQRLRDVLER